MVLDKLRVGKNTKHRLGLGYQEMPQAFFSPKKPINITTHLSFLTTLFFPSSPLLSSPQTVSTLRVCAQRDWQE